MTTLISLLGKATKGYRTANYVFDDGTVRTEPFFGMALLEHAKPKHLILAGTAGSMWDVFFEQQHTDDDAILALMDAVETQSVSSEMLEAHAQRLTHKLGNPVQAKQALGDAYNHVRDHTGTKMYGYNVLAQRHGTRSSQEQQRRQTSFARSKGVGLQTACPAQKPVSVNNAPLHSLSHTPSRHDSSHLACHHRRIPASRHRNALRHSH